MNIAIIGVGTTGTGIGQAAVLAGHNVALYDISTPNLQRAQNQIRLALSKKKPDPPGTIPRPKPLIVTTTVLEECAEANLIIECAPDKLDIKKPLFERLDKVAEQKVVMATTSSTLPISAVAALAKRFPERVVGLHFPYSVESPIVEIVRGDRTDKKVLDQVTELVTEFEKQAVIVQDTPGYVFHRISDLFTGEAVRVLGENRIAAEQIDKLMGALGFEQGPLRFMDEKGLDESLSIKQALYSATYQDPRYRPHSLHRRLVQAGHLGRKTRRGFHAYTD